MASIKEAFTNPDVAQGDFYSAQQIRYREVEPNRFLPDKMKGALGQEITKDALSQFDRYDPYTQKMSNKFSSTGLSQLLQGQGNTTNEETYCRGLVGAASLPKLIADQQAQGNSPIRCGWRYKPSPGGGAPQVSQGALGTLNGPLNPQADPLGNGVEWIWDLKKALNRHAKDFIATQLLAWLPHKQLFRIQLGVVRQIVIFSWMRMEDLSKAIHARLTRLLLIQPDFHKSLKHLLQPWRLLIHLHLLIVHVLETILLYHETVSFKQLR